MEWRTVRLTYAHQKDGPSWSYFSADESMCGWVKENAAAVAISALTLFLICLRAMICFSDVARAPPPPPL